MNETTTLGDIRPSTLICRERGWSPGTQLVGDEGFGPTVIEITALGRDSILACVVSHDGKPSSHNRETAWVLYCRDWKEV